jgi:hypothetical protein
MKTLLSGVIIMDLEMNEELNKKVGEATDKFLDRRALIFIEEAIANYNGRHGVKKTRQYLQYMLDYLEEFETEERKDV